ncbi:NUDIX hydrolase [Natronocalculus amylovorans]|uniref:NUDIX domain-containing protein n=1 Tax=Natronocalculus amylovorans TaxID=2917812 RepID=A0AAE3FXL1_9EURY|nr:NUDIX domain-containing protein [Natronocalculus amylovorans]MCL9816888.1 NUDIX domain-containing protein [Natronocalculus amylovorans]NUE01329.1 NUDIX domain-containing protein [Halorubraceae archaeon YAN]
MRLSHTQTFVPKACAYITRGENELLVFEGPEYDGYQIPKGTVEGDESPREAVFREIAEESGLGAIATPRHLVSDIWKRREKRWYTRHFFHTTVHEPRDEWTHTVTGTGDEVGIEYDFSWITLPTRTKFALDLDSYLNLLTQSKDAPIKCSVTQ